MRESYLEEEKAGWDRKEAGRLTKEKAHDEANMMQAELKRNPNTGVIYDPSTKKYERYDNITLQNYDDAFALIQELKEASNEEAAYKKVVARILRVASPPVKAILTGIDAVAPISTDSFLKAKEERAHWFEDAEKRLKDMQKLGDAYAKRQLEANPNTPEEK